MPPAVTHEDFFQSSAEEEKQYMVNEPSDFLKLANFIYNQFWEAKGVLETLHD